MLGDTVHAWYLSFKHGFPCHNQKPQTRKAGLGVSVYLMHTYSHAHKPRKLIHVSICVGLTFTAGESDKIKDTWR